MPPAELVGAQATAALQTPLGPVEACATDEGICRLAFADSEASGGVAGWGSVGGDGGGVRERSVAGRGSVGGPRSVAGARRHLSALRTQLREYFAGRRRAFDLPLVFAGTGFQEHVWRELLRIPFGETISYEELARRAGSPGASRAAGQANGRNPIAIVVPCHRVVRATGEPGGYAGGPDRKLRLLDLEAGGVQGTLFGLP